MYSSVTRARLCTFVPAGYVSVEVWILDTGRKVSLVKMKQKCETIYQSHIIYVCMHLRCGLFIPERTLSGSKLLTPQAAVTSRIRDQQRPSSSFFALCGVCHSKLALSQWHWSTIRLAPQIIAVMSGGKDESLQRKRSSTKYADKSLFYHFKREISF